MPDRFFGRPVLFPALAQRARAAAQPLRVLTISLALLACGCFNAARLEPSRTLFGSEQVEVPMPLVQGLPCLVDSDRHVLLVDTGATCAMLSETILRDVSGGKKLPEGPPVRFHVIDAHNRSRAVTRIVRVEDFRIGGVKFEDFYVLAPPAEVSGSFFDGRAGILGLAVFRDCLLTLDYPRSKLALAPVPTGAPAEGAVPLRVNEEGLIEAPMAINGRELWAVIDSGDDGGITLPEKTARDLPFERPPVATFLAMSGWGKQRLLQGRLAGDLLVGGHVFRRPIVSVLPGVDRLAIGTGALKNFMVSLDQRHKLAWLRRVSDAPVTTPPVVHCGFVCAADANRKFVVIDVVPNTAAEAAGLRPGDVLLSLNGVPFDKLEDWAWQERADAPEPLELHVRRAGRELSFTFRPTVLVR